LGSLFKFLVSLWDCKKNLWRFWTTTEVRISFIKRYWRSQNSNNFYNWEGHFWLNSEGNHSKIYAGLTLIANKLSQL